MPVTVPPNGPTNLAKSDRFLPCRRRPPSPADCRDSWQQTDIGDGDERRFRAWRVRMDSFVLTGPVDGPKNSTRIRRPALCLPNPDGRREHWWRGSIISDGPANGPGLDRAGFMIRESLEPGSRTATLRFQFEPWAWPGSTRDRSESRPESPPASAEGGPIKNSVRESVGWSSTARGNSTHRFG